MDQLVSILSDNSSTEKRKGSDINEEQVEDTISSILSKILPTSKNNSKKLQSSDKKSSTIVQQTKKPIVLDQDNYDDEEEEEDKCDAPTPTTIKHTSTPQNPKDSHQGAPVWTGPKVSITKLQKRNDINTEELNTIPASTTSDNAMEYTDLDDIPLGRIGARMMITFGDGPKHDPNACVCALMGTRLCLQNAVKDARALRRQERKEYKRAKVQAHLHRAKFKDRQMLAGTIPAGDGKEDSHGVTVDAGVGNEIRSDIVFELQANPKSRGKLAYELQCGFDETQLETLFPEEMQSYQRWRKMHKAYTDSKGDDEEKTSQSKKDDSEEDNDDENINNEPEQINGGHLHDRLVQFDARTDRMKEAWYLAFSEVRQGSFLNKSSSQEHQQWEKLRKTNQGRGKPCKNKISWAHLPPSQVQFLHWIGFDPGSALTPPEINTTEALAFLAYDFMGKIVEKAIFLRCMKSWKEKKIEEKKDPIDRRLILQLEANEQLTKDDIERSLKDSKMTSKPLYNAVTTSIGEAGCAQLYFGPGFENRIEMELEQICMKKQEQPERLLSTEETEIRVQEDALFSRLKTPPKLLDGVMDLVEDHKKTDELVEQRSNLKKRERKRDDDRTLILQSALSGEPPKKVRKRGRPKKLN